MIVVILPAYLNRTGKREYFRDAFLGVGAALVLATAGRGDRLRDDPEQRGSRRDDLRDDHVRGRRDRADLHDVLDA